MRRILFLVPFFGRWPSWMSFYLQSCRSNATIDWLFFSDCGLPDRCPDNVRIESISFDAYCRRVADRLGISFRPKSPYKLCDLKPALGYVHEDFLDGYDYWAFGDIDVIYGNLRQYFDESRLSGKALLSTHERRISGHLCLVENTQRMRELFMHVPGWQESLADPAHRGFDEGAYSRLFIRHKNWPKSLRRLADMTNPLRRCSEFDEAFSTPHGRIPWVDGTFRFPSRWYWRDGELSNDLDGSRHFPYLHFIHWKGDVWPSVPPERLVQSADLNLSRSWCISALGFHCE
jgi:hypothetical protein